MIKKLDLTVEIGRLILSLDEIICDSFSRNTLES